MDNDITADVIQLRQDVNALRSAYTAAMSGKTVIYVFLTIGSIAGGWVPTLWGAGVLSLQGLVGSIFGGALGIWVGFKLGQALGA